MLSFNTMYGQIEVFHADTVDMSNWNHNQRKIVRSNKVGIIAETEDDIYFSYDLGKAKKILNGKMASLATDNQLIIHLLYVNNGIKYSFTSDYQEWSPAIQVSSTSDSTIFPIADCDGSGNVHVAYGIVNKIDTSQRIKSLEYVCLQEDHHLTTSTVIDTSKLKSGEYIVDYSLATNLLYMDDFVFISYQLSNDSTYLICSGDYGHSWSQIHKFAGQNPSVSIGPGSYGKDIITTATFPALLFKDKQNQLFNGVGLFGASIIDTALDWYGDYLLHDEPIDFYCIDDIIGPLGFSYIYQKNRVLYHAFSNLFNYGEIRDTVSQNSIYSSIAYKTFDKYKVDIVWLEPTEDGYVLYYNNYDKIPLADKEIKRNSQGLQVAAFPNPFSEIVTFKITSEIPIANSRINIYSIDGQLIRSIEASINNPLFEFSWDGTDQSGQDLMNGVYVINIVSKDASVSRKIIYHKNN